MEGSCSGSCGRGATSAGAKKSRSSSLSAFRKSAPLPSHTPSRHARSHTGGPPLRWIPREDKANTSTNSNPRWKMQYEGSEARREQQQRAERVAASGTGYLYKQGRQRKNWKQRLVTLADGRLQYSKDGIIKGAVDLTTGKVTVTVQPVGTQKTGSSQSSEWRFEVANGSEHIMLAAPSEEEMYAWVNQIEEACSSLTSKERVEKIMTSRSGLLFKQGKKRKNWKERMMIIEDGNLQYEKNGIVKTGIRLQGHQVSVCFKPGNFEKMPFRFKVENAEGQYMILAARTEAEMLAWITQIELMNGRPTIASSDTKSTDAEGHSSSAVVNIGSELQVPLGADNVGKRWNKFMHAINRSTGARSSETAGLQISSEGTEPIELDQVLHDPIACKVFKKFSENEHSVENLLFWIEAEEVRNIPAHGTYLKRRVDQIHKKFICTEGRLQVNLPAGILAKISDELDSPGTAIFADAQQEVYKLMERDIFTRFKAQWKSAS